MTSKTVHAMRLSGIIFLAVGYGWSGGHFYPANSPWWAYLFQYFVLALLLVMSLEFFGEQPTERKRKIYFLALSIFAAITCAINILNVLHGFDNATSFGSHNTLSDTIPIVFLFLGSVLWLVTVLFRKK